MVRFASTREISEPDPDSCNTPAAVAALSVLHPPVESAVEGGHRMPPSSCELVAPLLTQLKSHGINTFFIESDDRPFQVVENAILLPQYFTVFDKRIDRRTELC